jgi:broad specificity phosphatase PhoE
MKLIIIRHGETEDNIAGIFQGHLPGKLSHNGIEQAKKVALRLKVEQIDYIYSSDLKRATDTAKEIAKFHKNTPIEFTEKIRERNLGEFQGKKKSDFGWDAKDQRATKLQPKNGETMEDVYGRAKNFLQAIIPKHKNNTILFVCHGGVGKAIIAYLTGKDHSEIKTISNLSNASISIFEIDENKNHEIIKYNDTNHLI